MENKKSLLVKIVGIFFLLWGLQSFGNGISWIGVTKELESQHVRKLDKVIEDYNKDISNETKEVLIKFGNLEQYKKKRLASLEVIKSKKVVYQRLIKTEQLLLPILSFLVFIIFIIAGYGFLIAKSFALNVSRLGLWMVGLIFIILAFNIFIVVDVLAEIINCLNQISPLFDKEYIPISLISEIFKGIFMNPSFYIILLQIFFVVIITYFLKKFNLQNCLRP